MTQTHQLIKQNLQQILDQQYADGEERQSRESSIWGGSGADVKRAVSYASDAMRDPKPTETPQQYLENLISDITAQKAHYKAIEDDKDGYGSGTFVEIIREARALLNALNRLGL